MDAVRFSEITKKYGRKLVMKDLLINSWIEHFQASHSLKTESERRFLDRLFDARNCGKFIVAREGDEPQIQICGNRFCPLCATVISAEKINNYTPVLKKEKELFFLTLTRVNVKKNRLKKEVLEMIDFFSSIMKNRKRRKEWIMSRAYRKIEITYNEKENTFHPHIHAVFNSESLAQHVLDNWVLFSERAGKKISRDFQDLQKVDDVDKASQELFKYTGKLKLGMSPEWINGFWLLKGLRLFQAYGWKMQDDEENYSASEIKKAMSFLEARYTTQDVELAIKQYSKMKKEKLLPANVSFSTFFTDRTADDCCYFDTSTDRMKITYNGKQTTIEEKFYIRKEKPQKNKISIYNKKKEF